MLVSDAQAQRTPAILFASQHGVAYGNLDLRYGEELHEQGFQVDYTNKLDELTWDRIKKYNVLVLHDLPEGEAPGDAVEMVDRFLKVGGGVLLFPTEQNAHRHPLYSLTSRYGAKVPTERMKEEDKIRIARFAHMPGVVAGYTEQVADSPVSEGVKGVWYPFSASYNGSHTAPIEVDENWTVVLRGSPTSTSVLVDLATSGMPELEHAYARPEPTRAPAFFAIRSVGSGRLAFLNQWRVYTVGSGTKWLFDRQILSRGFGHRPSDMGRLLANTFAWLAQPSLGSGQLGGYEMPADRLTAPNLKLEVRRQYEPRSWDYDPKLLGEGRPPQHVRLYRGLIGARTGYSDGRGGVADYAATAQRCGIDFVVFAEDFAGMTQAKLEQLKQDCLQHSTEKVRLYPGLTMVDNIGNRMLLIGPDPAWVPDYCLTGRNHKVFYRQAVDDRGVLTGLGTPALDWALATYHRNGNIGYFHFSADPHANRIQHLRLYAMAGLKTYEAGKLLEDVTDDYLLCAAGTIPPAPVNVNLVRSPDELLREAKAARGLTYCQATGLDRVFEEALYWTHQYAAVNTFPSDGPRIVAWPACHRVGTLGAESFVTAPAVMPSPIYVTAEKGLQEVRIYNGPELYRRFILSGEKQWGVTLVLEATVQKNLVLVAQDVEGGQAVSYARRCWKDGGREVVFCSDHVNDCKSGGMLLAHGAMGMLINWPPPIHHSVAGDTWDGGPPAALPVVRWVHDQPSIKTSAGDQNGAWFNQTPICEFTDSGAVAVTSIKDDLFDPKMQRVVNPWHTFGPVGFKPKLMTFVQRYREWLNPTVGVPPAGWAGPGVREGGNASIYRCEMTFVDDFEVTDVEWFGTGPQPTQPTAFMALKVGDQKPREIDVFAVKGWKTQRLERGDWFALYSREVNSAQIMINRAAPMNLVYTRAKDWAWVRVKAPDLPRNVKKGEHLRAEIASLAFPVDVPVHTLENVTAFMDYLASPEGMRITRGRRAANSAGVVEVRKTGGWNPVGRDRASVPA
ncbi:MAG: hypothetical protein ACC645_12760, partial [Pirellulales bacterium]